jgi:hypothetical protein
MDGSAFNGLGEAICGLFILAMFGFAAFVGMIITIILLLLSLIVTLPFSPFWGFVVVPLSVPIIWLMMRKIK